MIQQIQPSKRHGAPRVIVTGGPARPLLRSTLLTHCDDSINNARHHPSIDPSIPSHHPPIRPTDYHRPPSPYYWPSIPSKRNILIFLLINPSPTAPKKQRDQPPPGKIQISLPPSPHLTSQYRLHRAPRAWPSPPASSAIVCFKPLLLRRADPPCCPPSRPSPHQPPSIPRRAPPGWCIYGPVVVVLPFSRRPHPLYHRPPCTPWPRPATRDRVQVCRRRGSRPSWWSCCTVVPCTDGCVGRYPVPDPPPSAPAEWKYPGTLPKPSITHQAPIRLSAICNRPSCGWLARARQPRARKARHAWPFLRSYVRCRYHPVYVRYSRRETASRASSPPRRAAALEAIAIRMRAGLAMSSAHRRSPSIDRQDALPDIPLLPFTLLCPFSRPVPCPNELPLWPCASARSLSSGVIRSSGCADAIARISVPLVPGAYARAPLALAWGLISTPPNHESR